jgi:predicted N-acetyltransferase YhbS
MPTFLPEHPSDAAEIETLLDLAFGTDRREKISYRYRLGLEPEHDLALVARYKGRLLGSIRYWPIRIDTAPALLLGPLAVHPELQGRGIGRRLIRDSLGLAEAAGWRLVFLVGDAAYYGPRGFSVVPEAIVMPGESPARVHYRTLAGAALPSGGLLLRADGRSPLEPGDQGFAQERHAFEARRVGVHLAQAHG